MVYASSMYSAGGVSYDIVAVDRTKEAIDSATQGIDTVGVKFSDTLTNIAFNFNMVMMAAQTVFSALQEGYNQTIGVAIAYQDQMDDMHNMLGITIEDAQKWKAAATATDTDITAVSTSMRYLEQRISDTGTSGENLRATLKGIGVDVKDSNGNYKDASTLLQEILAALNQIPAGAERANKAAEILGPRNWAGMADMIENADTAVKTFEDTHATMTDAESERIEKFKIKWAQLGEQIQLAQADVGLFFIDLANGIENAGATTGVQASAAGMGVAGLYDYFKTGNMATMDEAMLRFLHPERYTKEALADQKTAYDKEHPAASDSSITDQDGVTASQKNLYMGLSDVDREIMYQSEVVIPKYEAALTAAEAAGKGVAEAQYNLANAYDRLSDLKSQDTEQTKAQVDAYKEYQSAIEKANDAKKKLYDLDQSFAMDMQNAGMDVAAGRRAYQSYQKSRIGALETFGEAQMGVQESATEFNAVQSGTPLEQVKGTEQYEKAQATTIGQITIENINLSQDYTANDFMNDLTAGRIAKGVPLAK